MPAFFSGAELGRNCEVYIVRDVVDMDKED